MKIAHKIEFAFKNVYLYNLNIKENQFNPKKFKMIFL